LGLIMEQEEITKQHKQVKIDIIIFILESFPSLG
jgi:hypothetical protein